MHILYPCAHMVSTHLLQTAASCLFSSPICGGNYMLPSYPSTASHTLSKTTIIPLCTCIPYASNSPTMPSIYRPTPPLVPVRAEHRRLSLVSFYLLPALVTSTLFILWPRTQFESCLTISHMPHNCFLLIYWSILFTAHQGVIRRQ